ncbi:lysophospholipid acyltransferase family protein [Candidatus Cyrtobacter comes]|nr:lysophospholipid acyltransferase family protein [Candidatus Cyrtobacter comes]
MTYAGCTCVVINLVVIEFLFRLKKDVEGFENVPDGACIIACKHQSAIDPLYFPYFFPFMSVILKKELSKVPFMGSFFKNAGMIFIDRSSQLRSIKEILKGAKQVFDEGRKLVIFPEGTRVRYGQRETIKNGITAIARKFPELKIVPVSLDSGKYWPKGSAIVPNSTIKIRFGCPFSYSEYKEQIASKIEDEINIL